MSGRRRPSGRSPSGSTRPVVLSEIHKGFFDSSVLNALIKRSFSGYIELLIALATRRRRSRLRIAVDETAIKINGGLSWLYTAIDIETKSILDVQLFGRHGTDPAAAFLAGLREKHDLSDATFLVDQFGYRTALSRLKLNGQVDYTDRNLIEKRFHTLKMRVDRFHNSWVGSRASVREWLEQFVHYYNHQRPHQSLDDRTPAEEVLN